MNNQFFLELLPQPTFIIFVSTFAGAFVGEFYKEVNDKKKCVFAKFLSKFLASWMVGAATVLIFQAIFEVGKRESLIGISIFFGFIGHKASIKYMKSTIFSNFKKQC